MANSVQDQGLYSVSIEGVPMVLDQMGLANEVVAQWTLGETQEALIKATPEQASRLQELLHVRTVEPVTNGLYTDRTGKWYAVRDASVIQSGSWAVPLDVLKSVSKPEAGSPSPEPETESSLASPHIPVAGTTPSRETDPVCGMVMRPGQEAANVNYQGQMYHFCSDECRKLFLSHPSDYVQQKAMTA